MASRILVETPAGRRPNSVFLVLVALGALAAAIEARIRFPSEPPAVGLEWHVIVVLFVAAGLAAWGRRPQYRFGKILILTGLAMLWSLLIFSRNSALFTLSYTWNDLYNPLIAYCALSFPTGRLTTRGQVLAFWPYFITYVFAYLPLMRVLGHKHDQGFPGVRNLFAVHAFNVNLENYLHLVIAAWLAVIICLAAARLVRASGPTRRVLAPALVPAMFTMLDVTAAFVILFVLGAWAQSLATRFTPLVILLYRIGISSMFALPVGFLLGLYLERRAQARIGKLVVELDELSGLEGLETSLQKTLRDPSLRVAFYDRGSGVYRTAQGTPFDIDEDATDLVATRIERAGVPLGLMVHDRALLENPQLMESIAAAVRMAVDNDRLNAAVRAQLDEVRSSRARIVEASDAERRRIERNLHDGAQQRLVSLAMSLRVAKSNAERAGVPALVEELERSADALERAIAELRELAQGIHPAVLTEEGLRSALEELAETSRIPIRLTVDDDRFPAPVEATAYFLVSEALANASKHAGASVLAVTVRHADGVLTVEVVDDGAGGADFTKGSGLRGLQDRVAAQGGTLSIESPSGGGTRLTAEIPCALRSPTTQS
jgi:signal transduction histidine kinase